MSADGTIQPNLDLNDLFQRAGINPGEVLVLRHRPPEKSLNDVLPWLAAENPDLFNAYQHTQSARVEKALLRAKYVASFIGNKPRQALFVGLYAIHGSKPFTYEQYWQMPENIKLKKLGMKGFSLQEGRAAILCFDLRLEPFLAQWKGKLTVRWSSEISWCRWAAKNEFSVTAILEDSALVPAVPSWNKMVFDWQTLRILPEGWKRELSRSRGVYYIFDTSDCKGYVGSACGADNILGRWLDYGATGDGGNTLLRGRDPESFQFSILQRVSPDEERGKVVELEGNWKRRLHTRSHGLNDN